MTKYLIIASLLRSGSHMLRSMLSADPSLYDAGQWLPPGDGLKTWIEENEEAAGDRTMVINAKVSIGRDPYENLSVAKELDAPVLFLTRNNLLARVLSWELVLQRRTLPDSEVLTGELDIDQLAGKLFQEAVAVEQFRAAIVATGVRSNEIAYEELLVNDRLQSVLSGLMQRPVVIGQPITEKATPPLYELCPALLTYMRS